MKIWERKAEQRLKGQKLQDNDVVFLLKTVQPQELQGRRAEVVAARGVPGLDRVR